MADGNLGDLWFQLGVKDNTSKELQKIIDKLKTGDDAANALLRALQGFGTKKSGFKEQAEKAKEFADILNEINRRISKLKKNDKSDEAKDLQLAVKNALSYLDMLQRINIERSKISELRSLNPNVDTSKLREAELMLENINNQLFRLQNKAQGGGGGGVDSAKVLQDYAKVLQMTFRDVKQITDQFKKENPLSAFSGGAAKVEADIARVTEKLARMRDLMAEGSLKGYNTNMLGGSITELDKILARLQAASGNKSILTDAAQMKNLLSDVAVEMTKAAAATQAYGREKGKVIAQEREFAAASKLSAKDNDAELKALSDYAKRYMALQEAKRKAEKQASDERKRQSAAEARRIEADTERMSRLYAKMSLVIGRGERAGMRGLELGVNTSALEKALSEATELKRRIEDANIALMGKGGRPSYSSYAEEVNKLSSSLANATQAQRELNSVQDKANRKAEVQAAREASQAKREEVAAEKQRQNELKNTERRYDSLGNKVRQLRSEYSRGITIGADVSKAEAEINRLISIMRGLRTIKDRLNSENWKDSLGMLGNIGSGHDTTLASRVLQDQKAINREIQRGVELEQKRQQEIAQTAAKVQSDLVRGFERANSHAGKLNSTVQDLKSLFLQGGLVFGAQQFAMSIITTGGEMEKQHIALQSILGDMQNANTMFNQIKELALNSPFTFSELNRDVKQLAAYGVEYDQLYDTTKRLADMSSGLGVSFDRIALAFGQVQARGWLDGKELRQIAYAGIPLLDKLSKFYSKQEGRNISTSEIKTRISNREVSFDDVKSIFWQMTDAGGQFYNMQQVLSETLLGRYNKLKDAWEIMLAEFASGDALVGKFFKTAIDGATALVQSLHTLAMPIGAIFAGYAFKKMAAGNTASSFLSNKANLASDIQNKVLQGQALTQIEQRILATKNQITGADLRALANARALTTEKLNQLRLSGKITAEQYSIYRGIVLRQTGEKTIRMEMLRTLATMRSMSLTTTLSSVKNVWTGFQASALAAFRVIGTGAKTLVAGIWSAIGGLPGLIITAVTFGITYAISEYQELSQKIKQTQDEIADKNKQIRDFLRDNNVNIAISGGDTKEIDNMIDSYKEKLKELAPYSYKNMLMTAEEKKSHADRLKYLEQEIKLLKEANDIASAKLSNRGYYSDLSDATEDVIDAFKKREEMRVAAMASDASTGDKELYANETAYDNYIESLKKELAKRFGDIGKDEKMREAAMQAMSGIFSSMGIPEDKADIIRTSILQAFGCGDKSAWLQAEVSNSMIALIDKSFPMIGEKIKASIPLNDAEKAKVKELMNDAKNGLIRQYPELERTLQNMLAASNFQAVIRLVLDGGEKLNNLQSELVKRIPSRYSGLIMSETSGKYKAFAEKWGKEDSWYSARNSAQSDIDKAKNEYLSAKASKAKKSDELYTAWQTVKQAAKDLLYYDYDGSGKKSNKVPKGRNGNSGRKEDIELKRLQERLSSLKSARQVYQKYKSIMSDEEAKKKTYNLFPEVTGLNLDDYQKAVHSLLGGFSINTTERKKFQTSIYREVAEWLFDEKDKKEYERKAADFTELLNRLSSQWDLYKELFSKTGDKNFSSAAFNNPGYIDDKAKELIVEYNNKFGKDFQRENAMSMSDGVAKETLKGPGEYEAWKKIVDLLRNNYIKILQDAADIIEKTEDYEDKILKIRERYNELISKTNNPGIKARYEIQRDKEIGKVKLDKFKNSSDYLNFYGAIVSLGMDKAQTIGARIRQNINEALQNGAIDAREYAKEIKQLDEQLSKLTSPKKTFLNGGLKGMAEQKISDASEQMTIAASKIAEGKKVRELGLKMGDENFIKRGDSMIASGKAMMKAAEILFKDGTKAKESLDKFANVVSIIDQNVQGMSEAFNDIKETASLLGADTESDGWQDASAFFETFSGMSSSLSKVVTSAESGNVGGILAGVTGIFTSPIKAFAKAHDAKLDRQIKLAERQLNELKNLSSNISSVIEKTLGGIYSYNRSSDANKKLNDVKNDYKAWDAFSKTDIGKNFFGGHNLSHYSKETYDAVMKTETNPSAYADQLALLHAQEDELRKQRQAEEDKKKTDKDKIADYDQQIKEMQLQIKTFAQDFLKDVYSIDMKSWGNQLTDTVVSAWTKGEDAVEAYKNKVKEMVREVTKNIVSQKIMEKALEKPLEWLTGILDEKGKLDETDMDDFADKLYQVGENVVPQLTGIFDALKEKGLDLRENGSSSLTNSIKGITEETGDLFASYLNAIRLDVSVIREMQGKFLPEMSEISKSQLTQLNLIARNTLRNADAAERIEKIFIEYNDNFNRVINGTKSLKMK